MGDRSNLCGIMRGYFACHGWSLRVVGPAAAAAAAAGSGRRTVTAAVGMFGNSEGPRGSVIRDPLASSVALAVDSGSVTGLSLRPRVTLLDEFPGQGKVAVFFLVARRR